MLINISYYGFYNDTEGHSRQLNGVLWAKVSPPFFKEGWPDYKTI